MNSTKAKFGMLLTASISAMTFSSFTLGQEDDTAGTSRLEEIVVTARKRQESIQDVPVAVTALSPGQLERGSIVSSLELGKLVPNVELHETAIGSESLSASIRGTSYDDIEKSIEPTVGVAIDGVFLASNSGGVFDLFDVESLEVLRGPQGTLFGRNTIGGVINVQRTEPTGEWGAKLEATAGDEKRTDLKAVINLPLGENGGIKLSLKDTQSDSHVYNTTINGRRDFKDSQTASMSVKYNFGDSTSAMITFDDYDHDTTAPDNVFVASGVLASIGYGAGSIASEADDWKTSPQLTPLTARLKGENTTIKLTHETENHQIKYIMGIMDYDEDVSEVSWGLGPDSGNGVFFPVDRIQTFKQTSHEIQIISDLDGPLNYVAGLYHLEADSYIKSGPAILFRSDHELEATAVFGEMSYDLSDIWSVTLGARYTEEDKTLIARSWAAENFAAWAAQSEDQTLMSSYGTPVFADDNISYRLVVQREIASGMIYASYATGFRSGGFFNRGTTFNEVAPFESEEVASIEFGIRSNPTETSQINLTYFNAEYTDKQITVITNASDPVCGKGGAAEDAAGVTCSFVRNAGEVSMSGIEFEGILMPTDELTIRASVGTFDGDYDKYDYNGTDISDKARLLYAPELTAYFGAEHMSQFAGGTLSINGGLSYKDKVETQANWATYDPVTGPPVTIESFESLDLSATYLVDMGNGTLKVRVYGTDILESGNRPGRRFDAGAFAWAELVPRRQFGVTLGYEF